MIDEERLRAAAREAGEALLDSLPPREQCGHDFSPRFEAKMAPLLKRKRHLLFRPLTRAACILLALLLTGGVWLGADASAREAVTGWLRGTYETLFVYRFVGTAKEVASSVEYRPTWLPDGWEEFDSWEDNAGQTVVYLDAEGQLCYFMYTHEPASVLALVTEAPVVTLEVAGVPADFYDAAELDESSSLVWTDSEKGVVFMISAYISRTEFIRIAESISDKK